MTIVLKKLHIYLELVNAEHHKFYDLVLDKNLVKINYGRIGRLGKLKVLYFQNSDLAAEFFDKQIFKKYKKGYRKSIKGITPARIKGMHPGQLQFNFVYFLNKLSGSKIYHG